jgi:hypothetical protein
MSHRLSIPASLTFQALTGGAHFRDRIAVRVQATPEAIFQALETVTLADMPLAWLLGELRYLPARLTGHGRRPEPRRPFLSILKEGGTLILLNDSPREIVTGSAGQLHRWRDQAPVRFESREQFDTFGDPRYEKLFMSLRVEPTGRPGEQWLILEHATRALSHDAERKFRRYWRVIKPLGAFVSRGLLLAVRRKAQRTMARGARRHEVEAREAPHIR